MAPCFFDAEAWVVGLGELIVILELHQQGLSVSAIAERMGMDRKTVRKYIAQGVQVPRYGPRRPRPCVIDPYRAYLTERVLQYPELSIARLLREIRELGYRGGRTAVGDVLRSVRPPRQKSFEVRFETPAGHQAQVDFAHFLTEFEDTPGTRRVWLFSMVLGHSRYLWARFVAHQDLQTVLRCHLDAFEHFGGAPREILYDRMKTAVLGEGQDRHIVYNAKLVALAQHYGFAPRACQAYRAKTKGKVERPFRYIRQDFFMARRFRNLDDLNRQLRHWLDSVANVRLHATTQRIVAEHFAEERPALSVLPSGPFNALIRLERRVSHEGFVSVGGNYYSVPDRTRKRVLEIHSLAREVRIFEEGTLLAAHPVLEGRRQSSILPGHRTLATRLAERRRRPPAREQPVARRPLDFYDRVGRRLAGGGA